MTPKTEMIFSDIIQAALDITLNFIDSSLVLLNYNRFGTTSL
jgi:hypothetical protein